MLSLHKYQLNATRFILSNRQAYVMIDVGLGKTAITLEVIDIVELPAIVFAPLRAATVTWPEEIKKWKPNLSHTVLYGKDKDKKLKEDSDIYIVSFSSIKWFYEQVIIGKFHIKNFILVVDEASMVKNSSTQRFKLLKKLLPIFSSFRINLSATPNPNGYQELWSQYYLLDEGYRLGGNYFTFRSKYFNYYGPPSYRLDIKEGSKQKIRDKIKDITFRLEADDYVELPDVLYNKINVNLPPKALKNYKELQRKFLTVLNQTRIMAFSATELSIKLRQMVQGAVYYKDGSKRKYEILHKAKLEALKELLEIHSGHSILCAIQFRFEYDLICDFLKQDIPLIAGKTSVTKSLAYIERWNRQSIPLLICHPSSISHGVNLQAGGNIVIWYGIPWSLEQYKQFNGRLARQGQKQTVVINNIIANHTIDEVVFSVLAKKNSVQNDLLKAMLNYHEK